VSLLTFYFVLTITSKPNVFLYPRLRGDDNGEEFCPNLINNENGPLIHEKGHPEAWYIVMDVKPSEARTLDYGLRWGIEALFSGLKTRGFSVIKTQIIISGSIIYLR
jgi:hypothetical protein